MTDGTRRRSGPRTSPPRASQVAADEAADVIVVGGGLSGLIAAERLASGGASVLVLEAGRVLERRLPSCDVVHYRETIKPLTQVDADAWAYRTSGISFDWIRVRAGGGRSLVWGGWLLWPEAQNFKDAAAADQPWPFPIEAIATHIRRARNLLNIRQAPMPPHFAAVGAKLGLEVEEKLAAVGPCGCRAFVSLDWRRRSTLRPNRVVLELLANRRGRVTGVSYVDAETGARGIATGRAVVLAASPIETARLLLASPGAAPANAHGLVGTGLTDHLVASYLVLVPQPAPATEPATPMDRAAFVPRFVNLGRKNRRDYPGGFTLELHGPEPLLELGADGIRALGLDPTAAADASYFLVHAIGETLPHPDRKVTLDPDRLDRYGRRIPVIHQAQSDAEPRRARDMEETALAVADALATPGSRIFPLRETLTPGGIAHEAGGAVLGRSPQRAVTDLCGRVQNLRGLYVADASLMPTGLDRPPTLTVLGLAMNTADSLLEHLATGAL
ncbi:MAG: GMC family oxidoreductase [Deltaproteobacteria bacterium]|nr:GMC family oxidoreductase [Deltaproteobacteria bacterium]